MSVAEVETVALMELKKWSKWEKQNILVKGFSSAMQGKFF